MRRWVRAALTGVLAGCILLTRSESFIMLLLILLLYPFLTGRRWNYAMTVMSIVLAFSMWMPHQYSIYNKYGDFFYTANQYARFYANREFADEPGFPTKEEIGAKGMYYGPKITPWDYYWRLHSSWQLITGSIIGFAKIHLKMPFAFISGRGNAAAVKYAAAALLDNPGMKEVKKMVQLTGRIFMERWMSNLTGLAVLITFLGALVLMGLYRHWMWYWYLLLFQIHTAFLAFQGLDERLTVHAYPLIALCCGFCFWIIYNGIIKQSHSRLYEYKRG